MDCFFVVLKCRVCEIFRTFRFSRFLHVSFFKSSTFRFAGLKKAKYRRLYYVCLAWLIMNALATALVWGRFIGISTEECASIWVKNTQYLSGVIGIGFCATNFIVYCAPILTSALFSWILFAITKRQIKLKNDIS